MKANPAFKKNYFLIIFLFSISNLKKFYFKSCLFLIFSFVGLNNVSYSQINYTFNFNANSTGWIGNFARFTGATACGGTGGAMRRNLYASATTGQLISPTTGISNGMSATISYTYKAANWNANTAAAANWGNFIVQYGATAAGPWTNIATVTNETQLGNACISKSHTVVLPAGNTFIRFAATWQSGDYFLNFDNVTITQTAAVACTGTPAAGTAAVSVASGCSGAATTLSSTGITSGIGISYQWQSSPTNAAPWTNVAGATTTSANVNPTATLYYRLVTTCSNSGMSNNSSSVLYTVTACTLIPLTGNNSVPCGTNTSLKDHAGDANYSALANGYTVLNAAYLSVININGTYNVEACCDAIEIYNGVGTGGTLLATYAGVGTINYTGTAGQTLTVRFRSDGSIQDFGLNATVTYTGSCVAPPCAGVPNASTASLSSASGCAGSSTTLVSTGFSATTGVSYQWQSSPTGVAPWTNVAGGTTTSFVVTPASSLYYRMVSTCSNSGSTNNSNAVLYSVTACTLIPFTGSNSLACGTNTTLKDHAGDADYSPSADGYTVLNAVYLSVININGTYNLESCCDAIEIYNGVGTGGTLLATYFGAGTINYTGTAGQTLTVRFRSDGSVQFFGLTAAVTYTGSCIAPPCAGVPNASTASLSAASGCTGSSTTLISTGFSTETGVSYQWQSSPTGAAPWTNVAGGTTSSFVVTPASSLYYRMVSTCSNSGSTNNSNAVLYSVTACTLIPFTGFNTVSCGTNTTLKDHAGDADYSPSANGYTVLTSNYASVININGTYNVEACCDAIEIYSGVGIGGTLLASYVGSGTINYTAAAGQTITVRFRSDGSIQYFGLSAAVTYTGSCFAPYQAVIQSVSYGASNWCAGESRTVTVSILNAGTSAWTNSTPDINIGLKWNTDGGNWTDYHLRTDANGLAPGATGTYTFTVQASNNTGAGFTTPLAAGANNLRVDLVNEGNCWFANNSGSCGPGNAVFVTPTITIIALPVTNAGVDYPVCSGSSVVLNGSATGPAPVTVVGTIRIRVRPQNFGDDVGWRLENVSTGAILNNVVTVGTGWNELDVNYAFPVRLVIYSTAAFNDNNPQWEVLCDGVLIGSGVQASYNTSPVVMNNIGCVTTVSYPITYNWTGGPIASGASTAVATVNPISTLNYTLTATANGCSSSDIAIVTAITAAPASVETATSIPLTVGDLLWSGNSTTVWGLNTNWYAYDGTDFVVPVATPTASNRVFILPSTTPGTCISAVNNNTITSAGDASSVFIGTGATMNIDAGQTLNVNGNWTNNGTFNPNATATVNFTGTHPQTLGGASPSNFTNLSLNKASNTLTLNNAASVSGTLTMTSGNIATTVGNLLTVGTSPAAPGSIVWTGGTVVGPLRRHFSGTASSTQASGIFPVGLSGVNRYAQVNYISGLSTGGTITAEYVPGACPVGYAGLPNTINGQMIQNYENEGYWEITPSGGDLNTATYSLILRGNTLSTVTSAPNMAALRLMKSVSHTTWDNTGIGSHAAPAGGIADFTISNSEMTGFSFFNIGSGNANPLPVTLLDFAANCNDKSQVEVKWTTATEQNSNNFIIERSRDLVNWEFVADEAAAGNSNHSINYQAIDTDPIGGTSYYRMLQIDLNGVETVYGPISTNCNQSTINEMVVFPNPTKGNFTVEITTDENLSDSQLVLTDLSGKVISTRSISIMQGKTQAIFENQELQLGTYIIHLNSSNHSIQPVRVVVN